MTSCNKYPSSSAILKVQKKIARINNNPAHAKGLTSAELDVAIETGLIDKKHAWFWAEAWQNWKEKPSVLALSNSTT